MAGLFGKLGQWVRNRLTGPKVAPTLEQQRPSTGPGPGHRGIATGKGPGITKIPINRATLPQSDVDGFVYGGEPFFVNSSNVAMAQYYPETHQMQVEYLAKKGGSGSSYLYSNVSEQEAISFATAQSKGIWVWTYLRVRGSKTAHRKPYVKISGGFRKPTQTHKTGKEREEALARVEAAEQRARGGPLEIDLTNMESLPDNWNG